MKTLAMVILAAALCSCGDVEQSVSDRGDDSSSNAAAACSVCLDNFDDDLSDRECLAQYGFTLADC